MLRGASMTLIALGVASLMSQGAEGAVTVLGNGLAHTCFNAAEFGENPTDGIAACSEALEQTALPIRDRAATLVNRGILYSRINQPQMALADYDRGIAMSPSLGEAYVDRGAALIVLRARQRAKHHPRGGVAGARDAAGHALHDATDGVRRMMRDR